MNEPFWMVWNVGGRVPAVRHSSLKSATVEALRLARANPGERFVVLVALGHMRVEPENNWTEYVEIPF